MIKGCWAPGQSTVARHRSLQMTLFLILVALKCKRLSMRTMNAAGTCSSLFGKPRFGTPPSHLSLFQLIATTVRDVDLRSSTNSQAGPALFFAVVLIAFGTLFKPMLQDRRLSTWPQQQIQGSILLLDISSVLPGTPWNGRRQFHEPLLKQKFSQLRVAWLCVASKFSGPRHAGALQVFWVRACVSYRFVFGVLPMCSS